MKIHETHDWKCLTPDPGHFFFGYYDRCAWNADNTKHLVFSPDGEWLLADTYPQNGVQSLALVKVTTGELRIIGRFRHEQPKSWPVDVRCDLHPRWSADGSLITVDSIHSGERKINLLEFSDKIKF